jgi:ribosomal protein S18 acetylase RimI-like enzyme
MRETESRFSEAKSFMIRSYRPTDLPIIQDIGNRAWRGIYAMFRETLGDDIFALTHPNSATAKGEQIRAHCEANPDWIFICEEDGLIVGFVTFLVDAGSKIGTIGNNAVDPDCGLKGIGQQMYAAVLNYFREQGMLVAQVHTGLDEAHAPARRAYERAGFDVRHEEVVYYQKL